MKFFEIINDIFSHPFTILVLGGLVGKFYFLPHLLKDKSITYKAEIIKKICEIKNIIKEIEFLYDRTFNTLTISRNKGEPIPPRDIMNKEIGRLSAILNEKLPLSKKYLDTEIEIFFQEDKSVRNSYDGYIEQLNKLHNFILNMPSWKDGEIFASKFADLSKVKEINFPRKEKELISVIQDGVSIYDSFK